VVIRNPLSIAEKFSSKRFTRTRYWFDEGEDNVWSRIQCETTMRVNKRVSMPLISLLKFWQRTVGFKVSSGAITEWRKDI